jgi:pre-mRNA-processing factor SLU7
VSDIARKQIFAWEAEKHGADLHLQAEPTKVAMLYKTFEGRKEKLKEHQNQSILDKVRPALPPLLLLLFERV